jgi:hypothetical protein
LYAAIATMYARLAGLTNYRNVRDQLIDFARGWTAVAQHERRSDDARVLVLRQPPLHQKRNNDQDDNQGRENVSASTVVSIDTATRTALHDLVQAPSTHGHTSWKRK